MQNGRPAYKEQEVVELRDQICRTALSIISSDGIESLSFRKLADVLGSSHTKVYRYFPNKDALIREVRDYAFGQFAEALSDGFDTIKEPAEQMRNAGYNYFLFAHNDPNAFQVLFDNFSPDQKIKGENQQKAWSLIRDPIAAAVNAGHLVGDPDVLAYVFWGTIHGITALHHTGNVDPEIDINKILQLAFEGLGRGHGVPHE